MNLSGGIWINEDGFTLRDTLRKVPGFPPWRKRTLYEFTLDPVAPLTFHLSPHIFIQPDRHGFTELGSIPEVFQLTFAPKDLHNPSFLMHDSLCDHKGLYFAARLEGPYTFCPMSSAAGAKLLGQCLYAAGHVRRAYWIWQAVRRFGPQFDTTPGGSKQ